MRSESSVDPAVERLASEVIGAAIEVHKELGPGMPERSYLLALCYELELRRIPFRCEVPVVISYKGKEVGEARIDILVADMLVLELKAVDAISPVHKAQCLKYLRLLKLQLGLVINFNVERLADGIKRVIHSP
ncbi:GxxExxY protein [Humisphaera borealis]|uniref:GxxExxY protein n=2 Tax=Humisphaera borealis TaxID=2807512 RepID=A0A7M2X6N2_9BACT|nr:GxxExxY protein [Humisphaera borealis]